MRVENTSSDRRRRGTAATRAVCLVALSAVVSTLPALSSLPTSSADELKDRKHRVERKIDQAQGQLNHSSEELEASVRRLVQARSALGYARDDLATARGELDAAEALDLQMQAALDEAIAELTRARAELEAGRAEVAASKDELRSMAVQLQSAGGAELMSLSAVFTAHEPAQLSEQLSSQRSVMDKEAATAARLDASEVLLSVQEDRLQAAKQEVALRRRAAAENLRLKARLEERAQSARDKVRELVGAREEAKQQAAAAKAEDLQRLRQFRHERDKIATLLQRRAARAAARAARAARAAGRSPAPVVRSAGVLGYPVDSYITSPYGMRLHPIYRQWRLHDGTDFGAGCGTPIRAARGGRVVGRYYDSAYGNRVIIDHGWVGGAGLGTSYNHMSRFSTYVGERVSRGEVIGYAGTTGYSTGCHLHLMVFRNGATVDPMNWL